MDAGTLAEANVIEEDKTRLKAAQAKASALAVDRQEEASAMKQVAKPSSGGGGKKATPSNDAPKRPTAKAAGSSLTAGIPGIGKRK
jgi:hypothetical protein